MSKYEIGPLTIVDDLADPGFVNIHYTFTFCGVPNHNKLHIDRTALDETMSSLAIRYPNGELDVVIYDASRPFAMREISKFMSRETLLAFRDTNPTFFKGPIVFSDDGEMIRQPILSNADLQDRIVRRLQLAN